ncbi:MAG: DUF3301 domain-containing protein [Gammaproteobacteria bacterium]|nr:DUF3301 domain-containing protein [Gammaproteobacteria bacterium]
MSELVFLLGLALFGYYLWDSRGVDELATQTARQACQQRHLQFLDFSVEKQSTRLVLATGGQPQWRRDYCFEFHVGSDVSEPERYGARMTLIGKRPTQIEFDPHPVPDEHIQYVEGPGRCMRG